MRIITAIILSFLSFCSPGFATAGQYDIVLSWPDIATAKADPLVQQYRDQVEDLWGADRIIVVQGWRPSQDTVDGEGNVVHAYLDRFSILVSLKNVPQALLNASTMQLILDRDKCAARQVGCVVSTSLTIPQLNDVRFEPIFFGMDPPWGAFSGP